MVTHAAHGVASTPGANIVPSNTFMLHAVGLFLVARLAEEILINVAPDFSIGALADAIVSPRNVGPSTEAAL